MNNSRILRSAQRWLFGFILLVALTSMAQPKEFLVYFGTFAKSGSKGIYVSKLDLATGTLSEPELAGETTSSGFLAIHPNRKFLYATGDMKPPGDKGNGAVNAFAIDEKTGKLTFLNQQSSKGKGPAHVSVDSNGKCVLVANYGGGNIAALPIKADGQLAEASAFVQHTGSSVHPKRQTAPFAHSINFDPANNFAFVADLGLDKILGYRFDAEKGSLVANNPPSVSVKPGAGPRHFTFHPHGQFAYVINELDCTVTAFSYDSARGALTEVQTISTLPASDPLKEGYSTAEVQVHPSSRFLYGSNRGHDSIAVFAIDGGSGKLTEKQVESTQGKVPRNFGIDPTGQFLLAANQNSDSVVVFRIDQNTGLIKATGQKITVPMPVCVKFLEVNADANLPEVAKWPTTDRWPGKGTIQNSVWFRNLWANRRTEWSKNREKDKGAVVFLGDSITQGWGSLAKDFPGLKVANRGISGDTTRGVLFRLKEDVLDLEPAAIILLIGTNDIGLNSTPEDVAANIRAILAAIKARNASTRVIICKVMPSSDRLHRPADKIKKLNALVDDIVKGDSQFTRCDTWSIFADANDQPKVEEFPDLLHPNAAGYAKWTEALKPILTKLKLAKN